MKDTTKSPRETVTPLPPTINTLPASVAGLTEWKILLFVTAINSFSQRVLTQLRALGFKRVSTIIATTTEIMERMVEEYQPDLVVCPFLTKVIPSSIFSRFITLVVHPGPPGDAGPSALDWALLGDTGAEPDYTLASASLLNASHADIPVHARQRSHWGCIVFQANEHLDNGAIWAWEQYPLPTIGTTTKAELYQSQHSNAALYALTNALVRVYETAHHLAPSERVKASPEPSWQRLSLTLQSKFLGGPTYDRSLITAKARQPIWDIHTAEDVRRIIFASDSQPGAQLAPLTTDSKTCLFAYGAHVHVSVESVPRTLFTSLGYGEYDAIPNGTIIATRSGAVFVKTKQVDGSSAGVWITHGRIPKKTGSPLEPKITMADAIRVCGHGKVLEAVQEWYQDTWEERTGTWQEVYIKTIVNDGGLAQCVYWRFYNGAFSTEQCKLLLQALQWAVRPERGNVRVLALMGGSYFSNGIALNTIEACADPGKETWANINAIDDIVEFLVSDTHSERSAFMRDQKPLCERGIITVACLRGNAAAGGVAMAAACDVTMAASGVVLNPAYRAMGLHGSEFHSYSYLARCGPTVAAGMLRDMLPQSASVSVDTGLIDMLVGTPLSSRSEITALCVNNVASLLIARCVDDVAFPLTMPCVDTVAFSSTPTISSVHCAPWCRPLPSTAPSNVISTMCAAKRATYGSRETPLLLYRNEELSQMLLDSFHPHRSARYHARRYKFIRKIKTNETASRYANELGRGEDEEEKKEFDDAAGWARGEEWAWAGLPIPKSLANSAWTRIDLYPGTIVSSESSTSSSDSEITTPPAEHPSTMQHDITSPKSAKLISASTPDVRATHDSTGLSFFEANTTTESTEPATPSRPRQVESTPRSMFRKSVSGPPRSFAVDTGSPVSPSPRKGKFKMFKRISEALRSPGPRSPTSLSSPSSQSSPRHVSPRSVTSPNRTLTTASRGAPGGNANDGDVNGEIAQGYDLGEVYNTVNRPLPAGIAGVKGKLATPQTPPSLDRRRKISPPLPVDFTRDVQADKAIAPGYVRPKVEGEDQVDFPCLYDPDSAVSTGSE